MLTRVYIGMALGGLALFLSGCGSRAEPEKATPASKKKLLAGGAKLVTLHVEDNQLSGAIPSSLGRTELQFLAAGNNQLSGSIPESLRQLISLQNIDLRNNQLFTKCKSIGAIERVYESFWQSEGVVVDAIKLIK